MMHIDNLSHSAGTIDTMGYLSDISIRHQYQWVGVRHLLLTGGAGGAGGVATAVSATGAVSAGAGFSARPFSSADMMKKVGGISG